MSQSYAGPMRIGYSWPLARRRRMWISMGPLGWLTLGPFLAIGYLIVFAILAVVWLIVWAVIGIGLAVQAITHALTSSHHTRTRTRQPRLMRNPTDWH